MKKFMTIFIMLSLALVTIAQPYAASAPKDKLSPEVRSFLNSFTGETESTLRKFHSPGIAMAIIEKGKVACVITEGNRGDANSSIMTDRTVFNIGSVSKTFTAWGILKLVETGKLNLDAPAINYIKNWNFPTSAFDPSKITIRMLLSHTAGTSMRSAPAYIHSEDVPTTTEELTGGTTHTAVSIIQEPGKSWRYSGGGYLVLQKIIEDVTGQDFPDYMEQEIFSPLGMNNTDFELHTSNTQNAVPVGINLKATPYEYFAAKSAASANTTISDFIKFVLAGIPGNNKVLSSETLATAYSPASGSNDSYGLGYFLDKDITSINVVGHDGANAGWRAVFKLIPSTGDGIIVLTNSSYGAAVYDKIICKWLAWKSGNKNSACTSSTDFDELLIHLFEKGIEQTKKYYTKLKASNPSLDFSEGYTSFLGYDLFNHGFADDAIQLLEFNTFLHPVAANAFDSLGEIYMKTGNKIKAIEAYEKVLEIEPNNENAKEKIKKLKN